VTRCNGLVPLDPGAAVKAFYAAINCDWPVVHVMNLADSAVASVGPVEERHVVNPRRRSSGAPLYSHATGATAVEVAAIARDVLGTFLGVPANHVDGGRTFRELGLDSAVAVQALGVLGERLGRRLYPTLMFEFETPDDLIAHLVKTGEATPAGLTVDVAKIGSRLTSTPADDTRDIAIVGMACKVPGANNIDEFWDMLVKGRCAIRQAGRDRFPESYVGDGAQGSHTSYSTWGGYIDSPYAFDAMFFGISPREATAMDPQQRVFLEVAWDALQHAGYGQTRPRNVGVFVGAENNAYAEHFINHQRFEAAKHDIQRTRWYKGLPTQDRRDLLRILRETLGPAEITSDVVPGNSLNEIAARLSHFLDLDGPSVVVNSACSSSIVALHWACDSLRSGQSEMAIVGGVNLNLGTTSLVFLSKLKALSPTGRCLPFDADADGMVLGEGAAALLLKPLGRALSDGDFIHAVIKGSAINNDGRSQGITVPTARGQASAIRKAYDAARVDPASVTYVECHGTATPLGDPVEVQGLTLAFGEHSDKKEYCAIGSVKGSIGHLLSASGGPSVIKTVLALTHRVIPPSAGFSKASPHIDFASTPFVVATGDPRPWASEGPRRAGVNAFGFGGTNAHVVLEEYARQTDAGGVVPSRPDVMLLSARSPSALQAVAASIDAHLERHPDSSLASICHSLNRGQRRMTWKAAVVAADLPALRERLRAFAVDRGTTQGVYAGRSNPRRGAAVTFLFGTHLVLTRDEYNSIGARFPRFGSIVRGIVADLSSLGVDANTALFSRWTTNYALLRFFEDLGASCDTIAADEELAVEAAYFSGAATFDDLRNRFAGGSASRGSLSTIEASRASRARLAAAAVDAVRRAPGAPDSERVTLALGKAPSDSDSTIAIDRSQNVDVLTSLLRAVGRLYVAGVDVDGDDIHDGRAIRVPLPSYPFERITYRAFTPDQPTPREPVLVSTAPSQRVDERTSTESVRDATYQMLVAELNTVSARNYE
jgi:acyl transferase domain-containing protein/acyl carrier protein